MKGKLYGVSVGPGDPGLITRRAWELLTGDAHWTYPVRSAKSDSFALDIALRAGLPLPEEHTALVFPMTHDAEKLARHWLRAAETVLERLRRGEDVLFLVEGDASTYATFGHLARTVASLDAGVEIETVPGVSSFNAAAAGLGMPLAETDDTLAIVPAGYGVEMIDRLLADFDTLVLLKVKPVLDDLLDLLEKRGLLPHSAFIERAGTPEERKVLDLASLRGETVNYLSLILVRNPHRSRGPIVRGCRKKTREAAR
ncbi:precorrin-2 C(20)-methyltransferase [Thiohalobacter sp. IOR34]|uniref:precorrin-2 C(20)-methyltransferase n=1 Tax=Thiohalobacter sp. IOR34 TaxID=3057176 RepID=UPI0025B2515F|nr:precorrin-2 C(20)-methyltransferase [Thiohalobacter sp. IOR34]WJW75701.1 precorrin-2 C(20)-methyltransferase [Thiohalobacter sp. IOR34]